MERWPGYWRSPGTSASAGAWSGECATSIRSWSAGWPSAPPSTRRPTGSWRRSPTRATFFIALPEAPPEPLSDLPARATAGAAAGRSR
jgi:hypothetical protein